MQTELMGEQLEEAPPVTDLKRSAKGNLKLENDENEER